MYFYISTTSNAYYMNMEYDWRTEDLCTLTSKLYLINLFWYDSCLFDFDETIQQFPQTVCFYLCLYTSPPGQAGFHNRKSHSLISDIYSLLYGCLFWFCYSLLVDFSRLTQMHPRIFFDTQFLFCYTSWHLLSKTSLWRMLFHWATRLWPSHIDLVYGTGPLAWVLGQHRFYGLIY